MHSFLLCDQYVEHLPGEIIDFIYGAISEAHSCLTSPINPFCHVQVCHCDSSYSLYCSALAAV